MAKIALVGAGKMAEALICCLGSPQNIIASDVNPKRLSYLKRKYKIKIAKDNLRAFNLSEIVILAVKPQNIAEVVAELAPTMEMSGLTPTVRKKKKLVISIAAGIPLSYLQKKLPGVPVLRAMPNNPCLVGRGITALARGKLVNTTLYRKAEKIFKTVGEVLPVPEKWMHAVTGLSGSGPAFVYQVIEALTEGGTLAGLPKKAASQLALQTVLGAALTVKETGRSPDELREMVASPGGTTIEGLKVLQKNKFKPALAQAVVAAAKKSKKLSQRWTS